MNQHISDGRSVAVVVNDTKEELRQFLETRIAMLKTEVREKVNTLKLAAPLAAAGIVLLTTAYLLFTLTVVALVYAFLPDSAYRWCLAFLAVAVLWCIVGGVAAYFAKREFQLKGLLPTRTINILKGDKSWLQAEVKNQI